MKGKNFGNSLVAGENDQMFGGHHVMDELKFNKIFAGILLAGLLLMAGIKAGQILVPSHSGHGHGGEQAKHAYPIEVTEVAEAGAVEAPKGPEPILALLADADIAAGMKLAKKCTACHVFEEGGANKVGPAFWNIVNADKGAIDGFGYSAALAGFGGAWDYGALNAFLYKPKAYIEGTKMNFAGLKKPKDRANMIAYLRSLSSAPAALPTDAEIASEGQ
ncbi:MAG: c-type cytochrome [Candidatus Puniceispirillaceae bacterium]